MKDLTPEQEKELITTKFSLLQSSFPLFAFINLKIKNKQAQVQRFTLNKLQKKLWQITKEHLDNNIPIRFYFVKSRQTGSTTFWLGLIFWFTTLWKNRNAIILAQDDEAAKSIGDKFQNYWLRSHPLLKPEARKMNRSEVYLASSLAEYEKTGNIGHDCHIDNSTANDANLGRSYTYQFALLTEFGLWEQNGIDIKTTLSSLFQTFPEEPNTAIIIETTAKGEGFAKDFYENETNGFKKIFISWIADDTYRIDLPIGEYFDLHDSVDSPFGNEVEAKAIIESELKFWDTENKYADLYELHHEAMCRLAWRRKFINEKCFGDVDLFRQEYPLTIQDAFSTSSSFVFPVQRIEEQIERIKEERIVSSNFNFINDYTTRNQLHQTRHGRIRIYEQPEPKALYVIGGDGAQGIDGGDHSSLVCLRVPEMYEVFSFSDTIAPSEFGAMASYLSRLYNNALLGIEINDKGGYAAIESIRENHPATNLYYRRGLKALTLKDIRYGWHTNENTRSVMIEDLKVNLKNRTIDLFSIDLLNQLRTFVKLKSGKLAAAYGKKDDLVLALMIAIQMGRNIHIRKEEQMRKSPPKGSLDWVVNQQLKRREDFAKLRIV